MGFSDRFLRLSIRHFINFHAPQEQNALKSRAIIKGGRGKDLIQLSRVGGLQGAVIKPDVEAIIAPAAIPTPID